MTTRRAVIIYNPSSGFVRKKSGYVATMVELLEQRGIHGEPFPTVRPGDAGAHSRESAAAGVELVISHGGDGTVNEVVQGMAGGNAALAVWSGGTANVIAKDLGLPSDMTQLADIIAAGNTKRISLGRMTDPSRPNSQTGRYFVMMAGIGLDASVCREVNPGLKRLSGKFAFGISAMRHVKTWKGLPFMLTVGRDRCETAFAVVANGRGYGAPVCLAPDARLEDPFFQVFVAPKHVRNLSYLSDFLTLLRTSPEKVGSQLLEGRHVEAESEGTVWVHLDGEVAGKLPAHFDIVPGALSVIVPEADPAQPPRQ